MRREQQLDGFKDGRLIVCDQNSFSPRASSPFKARMRDALASKMTREQVAAAQEMARIWYKAQ